MHTGFTCWAQDRYRFMENNDISYQLEEDPQEKSPSNKSMFFEDLPDIFLTPVFHPKGYLKARKQPSTLVICLWLSEVTTISACDITRRAWDGIMALHFHGKTLRNLSTQESFQRIPLRSTTHPTSNQNESTSHLYHATGAHSTLCTNREAISLLGEFFLSKMIWLRLMMLFLETD